MATVKTMQLNNGNVITVPSVSFKNGNLPYIVSNLPGGYNRDWCYDNGIPNPATPMDLGAEWDTCNNSVGISSAFWSTFMTWRTLEEMESETMQTMIDALNGAMVFLWGNINDGGYGFIKVENYIETFWHIGIAQRTNGGVQQYRYAITRGGLSYGGNIARNMVTDCVLTCVENGTLRFPNLILWLSNKTHQGDNLYFTLLYDPTESVLWYWEDVPEQSASGYTSNPAYSSALLINPYPVKPWYIDNAHAECQASYDYDELYKIGGWAGCDIDDEDDPFNDTEGDNDKGGDGDFYGGSESTPSSDMDDISDDAINSGFVTLYKPTKPQLQSFNDWLWTSIDDTLSQQIKRILTNPMDAVLFVAETHLDPPASELASTIKFCGISSTVSAQTIPKQHKTYNCGKLQFMTVGGAYQNKITGDTDTFLDYQPYSKAEIYLPCIGYKEIDVNDLIGSEVSLTYHVDWVSGSCLAQLTFNRDKRKDGDAALNENTMYEFQGNVYTILPLSASDWKSFYSNVLSGIGGLASAISGNVAGGLTQMVSSVASQQVSIQKSGGVNSSYGFMGQQDIYVYLTRPNPAIPVNYKAFKGYVTNERYNLGKLHGYTEIDTDTLWVDGFNGITESEADMLRSICNSGFYL